MWGAQHVYMQNIVESGVKHHKPNMWGAKHVYMYMYSTLYR